MKALIVFDTAYGNTEQIARAIAAELGKSMPTSVLKAAEAKADSVDGADLVIAGAPTQKFRASEAMQRFLDALPDHALKGKSTAAFDTRISVSDKGAGIRFVLNMGGYAAKRIAAVLKKKGGRLIVPPEGFLVKGEKGPLTEGELERAANWAKSIAQALKVPAGS